jgi:hypothetical protein
MANDFGKDFLKSHASPASGGPSFNPVSLRGPSFPRPSLDNMSDQVSGGPSNTSSSDWSALALPSRPTEHDFSDSLFDWNLIGHQSQPNYVDEKWDDHFDAQPQPVCLSSPHAAKYTHLTEIQNRHSTPNESSTGYARSALHNGHDPQSTISQRLQLSPHIPIARVESSSWSTSPHLRRSNRTRTPEGQRLDFKLSMNANGSQQIKCPCPIFQLETDLGLGHDSCKGGGGDTLSGLYTHFARQHLKRNRPRHLPFLQRCRICQHYFINEEEFTTRHGRQCDTPNRGKTGNAAEAHYKAFCRMVVLFITEQTVTSTSRCISMRGII